MARPAKKDGPPLKRVQMDMPDQSYARLKRLQSKTESASYAEVVRNALRLYEALIQEADQGGQFYVKHGDKEVKLPIFGA